MKGRYGDIGIENIIRQRLRDIELQRWLSEINNDTRKDANQGNKMRTYRLFKTVFNYKRLPTSGHQYTRRNSSNKTSTWQPQISHRGRTLFETVQETFRKNLSNL